MNSAPSADDHTHHHGHTPAALPERASAASRAHPPGAGHHEEHAAHDRHAGHSVEKVARAAGFSDEAVVRMQGMVNHMPNLQFLEGRVNQSKLATPYADWIAPLRAKPDEWAVYRQQHAIPVLKSYEMSDFEMFFRERRVLLLERLKATLGAAVAASQL